jgi:predicted RNA-binding Zn-ribbon protein involved in translation (DUF1610 family)
LVRAVQNAALPLLLEYLQTCGEAGGPPRSAKPEAEQDAITAGLDCPCCGEDVLLRVEPIWYEDESEACSDCGCTVGVRVDDDEGLPTAYTKVTKGCADYGDADD